jgi:hypothetical protein
MLKTDSAFDIEKLICIIPPTGTEELFHYVACKILNNIAKNNTQKENNKRSVLKRIVYKDCHNEGSSTVNRTERASKKSSVDNSLFTDGTVN